MEVAQGSRAVRTADGGRSSSRAVYDGVAGQGRRVSTPSEQTSTWRVHTAAIVDVQVVALVRAQTAGSAAVTATTLHRWLPSLYAARPPAAAAVPPSTRHLAVATEDVQSTSGTRRHRHQPLPAPLPRPTGRRRAAEQGRARLAIGGAASRQTVLLHVRQYNHRLLGDHLSQGRTNQPPRGVDHGVGGVLTPENM